MLKGDDSLSNIKLSMSLQTNNDSIEQFKKLEHHIDYLLDLDNWPEIESVYDVVVEEIKSPIYNLDDPNKTYERDG